MVMSSPFGSSIGATTLNTAYNAAFGTSKNLRYKQYHSLSSPGGGGVSGRNHSPSNDIACIKLVVMVLILKSSKRRTWEWF